MVSWSVSSRARGRTARLLAVAVLAAGLSVVSAAPAAAATSIYVDVAASGFNDGSSWSNAFTDLQDALAAASPNDDVFVAQGTYRPHATDRSVSFAVPGSVTLQGGYATGGVAGPDAALYPTVLSGDLAGDDFAGFVNNGENSFHVVSISGDATIDRFTITAGNADSSPADVVGGGVLIAGGSPTFIRNIITGNNASNGGGVYVSAAAALVTVRDNTISNNTAFNGAGVSIGGSADILFNTITANNASNGGGGISAFGPASLVGNTVIGNTAQFGGGIYAGSGSAGGLVVDGLVVNNTAALAGGGLFLDDSFIVFGLTVAGNSAGSPGGGIHGSAGSPVVANSVVWGNAPDSIVGTPSVTFSDVEGGFAGTGNISADPLFVGAGNYRLQPASPARNVGDNGSVILFADLDGRPRVQGLVVDMGAYETPVPFDDFAAAGVLSGASGQVQASTIGSTGETGEPAAVCAGAVAPLNSVWFAWTAPATGPIRFDTMGSGFDTYMHAYSGASLGSLTELGCDDDASPSTASLVVFDAVAGTTYYVQVDGFVLATGDVTLNWGPPALVSSPGIILLETDGANSFHPVTIQLDAPVPYDVSVDWATVDVPSNPMVAHPGTDYVANGGTVTIPANTASITVQLEIINDNDIEPPLLWGEWGIFQFSNPVNAALEPAGFITGLAFFIIVDDD